MDPPRLRLAILFGNRGKNGRSPFVQKGGSDSVIGMDSNGVQGDEASVGLFWGYTGHRKGISNVPKRSGSGPVRSRWLTLQLGLIWSHLLDSF